jgi:hypothetical protein
MIRVTERIFDDLVEKDLSVWYWKTIHENKSILEDHLDRNFVYGFIFWNHDRMIMTIWRLGYDIPLISMPSWNSRKWEMLRGRWRKIISKSGNRFWCLMWYLIDFGMTDFLICLLSECLITSWSISRLNLAMECKEGV